ncbi:hypothetical protein M9H77_36485 [Catharanthus roseus]|uniref:Uncharacterized protein n=1 Tax=Catharanthus roseus TaxID=4058 RepID=A0ACB9ZSB7_CATRO|nr:hypothetical protein M9H77_36485 [Catharanthus roseus]
MNMDATHPVRVVLFWDLEHARDAYGPYFTGAAKKTWTFTRIIHQGIHVPCTGSSKQTSKYDFKICFKTNITSYCRQFRDTCLKHHPRSASKTLDGLYVQEGMVCSKICNREGVRQLGDNF